MGRHRSSSRGAPARTPEDREAQLAAAAYDLAETQIEEGTASSQVITHFLKAGSRREAMEQLKMAHEIELMEARREAMASHQRIEELYMEALNAMRSYRPQEMGELEPGDEV